MRDKRPVDELSVEELERILIIKKREARRAQIERIKRSGRMVEPGPAEPPPAAATGGYPDLPPELAAAIDTKSTRPQTTAPPAASPASRPAARPTARSRGSALAGPQFEDDIHDVDSLMGRRDQQAERQWRRFVNVSLTFVEIAAVIGLVLLGFALLTARDELRETTRLEQESANATRMAGVPTLEPTPILSVNVNDWVLPGGHTFDGGQPVINVNELSQANIPANLMPLIQQRLTTPVIERPPRTPETALRVSIPALRIDETIVQGADWEALRQGVGQVLNGARPGDETGNVALAAHNDIYGEIFRDLDQLQPGDEFTIQTEMNVYNYVVTRTEIVEPNEVWVLQNTGLPTSTLISCYPYGINDKRIIVFAERVDL